MITLVMACIAPTASASWRLVALKFNDRTLWDWPTQSSLMWAKGGKISGVGGHIEGSVWTRANTWSASQIQLQGTAFKYVKLIHLPPGVGEVELDKTAQMEGKVVLEHGPGAATATGYAHAKHKFDSEPWDILEARIGAAMATAETHLGEVGVSVTPGQNGGAGFQGTFPVTITIGLGTDTDDGQGEQQDADQKCPVGFWQYKLQCHLELRSWSYSDFWQTYQSKGRAEGEGTATISYHLLTHP